MALIRDGLLEIVNEMETVPTEGAEVQAKFVASCDKALVAIAFAIEPNLLYLTGANPTDPVVVWNSLADQFQHKTWGNKLELKWKVFYMRLAEGGSLQDHIMYMTEICDKLSVIGEAISEKDRVIYLLASLPGSYNMLVTALQASTEVPRLTVVRERLLHEETKMKSKSNQLGQEGALTSSIKKSKDVIIVINLGISRKNVKNLQKLKVIVNHHRSKGKTKWGHLRSLSLLMMRIMLIVRAQV